MNCKAHGKGKVFYPSSSEEHEMTGWFIEDDPYQGILVYKNGDKYVG